MTVWQSIYDSPWHQPRLVVTLGAAAWISALLAMRRTPAKGDRVFRAWLGVFGAQILVDAVLTASDSPLLPAHGALLGNLAIAFVLLGDARVYLLTEHFSRAPSSRHGLVRGLAWGSLVSVLMAPLARTVPAFQHNLRTLFLTYELFALTQAIVWRAVVLPKRASHTPPETLAWLRAIAGFVVVQYALWALADVLILWVHPAGYLLRLVPNVLYYGVFVGYVFRRAPAAIRP